MQDFSCIVHTRFLHGQVIFDYRVQRQFCIIKNSFRPLRRENTFTSRIRICGCHCSLHVNMAAKHEEELEVMPRAQEYCIHRCLVQDSSRWFVY